jgi:hypothetical protein
LKGQALKAKQGTEGILMKFQLSDETRPKVERF